MTTPSDALVFLDTIFRPTLEQSGGWLLIWQAEGKRSAWFRNVVDAATYAGKCESDTYIGAGISGGNYGPKARATADEVIAIPALWLDVDFLHPAHKSTDLPPDIDGAWQLIADVGRTPSAVVNTGHGLQAWWRIGDGLCAEEPERLRIAQAVRNWQTTLIEQARIRHGWRIDATHDLARLMRLPGTWNRKTDPVPVTLECIGAESRRN